MTSVTFSPLQLGKPRHAILPFSFPVGFKKSPVCMTSEGLLSPSTAPLRTLLSFGVAGELLRLLRSLGIRPLPSCSLPALPHLPQEGPAGEGLAVPPVPPSLFPDVQEAPNQETRSEVRADAAEASSGRGAGAAGGERTGPLDLRGPARRRGWSGRLGRPGGRKVAAGGRPGEPAESRERERRRRADALLAGDAWSASGRERRAAGPGRGRGARP